jgi:hypothetical protein
MTGRAIPLPPGFAAASAGMAPGTQHGALVPRQPNFAGLSSGRNELNVLWP